MLFVWTLTKFVGRLDMMRDIYHNWMSGVSFTVCLKEDPWVEAGPVELDFWMQVAGLLDTGFESILKSWTFGYRFWVC